MLRDIQESDYETLQPIIADCVHDCITSCMEEAVFLIEDIEQSLQTWFQAGAIGFGRIALEQGDVQGFVVVKEFWNLSHLFVAPRFQRNGVGALLTRAAVEACKQASPRQKIQLNSSSFAAEFYESLGFVQTGPGIDRPGGCIPYEITF